MGEQARGPFASFRHEHRFRDDAGVTEIGGVGGRVFMRIAGAAAGVAAQGARTEAGFTVGEVSAGGTAVGDGPLDGGQRPADACVGVYGHARPGVRGGSSRAWGSPGRWVMP